jgi:hypothetical protein
VIPFRQWGASQGAKWLALARGRGKKHYEDCCGEQRRRDRAWLIAAAGGKEHFATIAGDILDDHPVLLDLMLARLGSRTLETVQTFLTSNFPSQEAVQRAHARELGLQLTIAVFFETDLGWDSYHLLSHVFRINSSCTDIRLPSKTKLWNWYASSCLPV